MDCERAVRRVISDHLKHFPAVQNLTQKRREGRKSQKEIHAMHLRENY